MNRARDRVRSAGAGSTGLHSRLFVGLVARKCQIWAYSVHGRGETPADVGRLDSDATRKQDVLVIGRRAIAVALGVAFAMLLSVVGAFLSSPWSAGYNLATLLPIAAGATVGFGFGFIAAARIRLGWLVWLLTLPSIGALVWMFAQRCESSTPGDDCGILALLVLAWLAPWVVGLVLLGVATVLLRRAAAQ